MPPWNLGFMQPHKYIAWLQLQQFRLYDVGHVGQALIFRCRFLPSKLVIICVHFCADNCTTNDENDFLPISNFR